MSQLKLIGCQLLAVLSFVLPAAAAPPVPQAGPENGGLRLRWAVERMSETKKDGFQVRIDLVNVSQKTITLRTAWEDDSGAGDVKAYLAAIASIESYPEIAPWRGGLPARQVEQRTLPQPEHALKPGEMLSVHWQTEGWRLKNDVLDPTVIQNPEFHHAGLYSVHASMDVVTSEGTVRLRSNEQLVKVGESTAMPRHTYGRLWSANREKKTATLGLGSHHKIAVGDQFHILISKQTLWKLSITDVEPRYSEGKLTLVGGDGDGSHEEFPRGDMHATLLEYEKASK